jgi:hypothetical protein
MYSRLLRRLHSTDTTCLTHSHLEELLERQGLEPGGATWPRNWLVTADGVTSGRLAIVAWSPRQPGLPNRSWPSRLVLQLALFLLACRPSDQQIRGQAARSGGTTS